jgi:hypothetical protein
MTEERMREIADELASDLAPSQITAFVGILRNYIENCEDAELIDSYFYYAGVDVAPECRKNHPPAPPPSI